MHTMPTGNIPETPELGTPAIMDRSLVPNGVHYWEVPVLCYCCVVHPSVAVEATVTSQFIGRRNPSAPPPLCMKPGTNLPFITIIVHVQTEFMHLFHRPNH